MKKILITILVSLILLQIANAQVNVSILINGKPINYQTLIACKDSCYHATLSVSGGVPPYTYLWNTGATTSSINFCSSDFSYTRDTLRVTVTDAHSSTGESWLIMSTTFPFDQEICLVTVDSATNKNMVIWEQASDTTVISYNIYKETSVTNDFKLIGNVQKGSMSVFIDTSSNPAKESARYVMTAYNGCAETWESHPHKTMHLTINQGIGKTWNLIWEVYQGAGIIQYRIWRGTTSRGLQLIDSVANNSISVETYTDLNPPSGVLYYAIEMIPQYKCNPTTKKANFNYTTSFSNIADNKDLLGINELKNDYGELRIYPNPSISYVTIENKNNKTDKYVLTLRDVEGQEVFKENVAFSNIYKLDLTNIRIGMYILSLRNDKENYVRKVVIQR